MFEFCNTKYMHSCTTVYVHTTTLCSHNFLEHAGNRRDHTNHCKYIQFNFLKGLNKLSAIATCMKPIKFYLNLSN